MGAKSNYSVNIKIGRRTVDVTNVRAKHHWIDIRTNSTRFLKKIDDQTNKDHNSNVLLLPVSAFHQIFPVTASDFMLCLSEIQSLNALRAAVNIYFQTVCGVLLHLTPTKEWI